MSWFLAKPTWNVCAVKALCITKHRTRVRHVLYVARALEAVERTKTVFSDIVLNELLDAFTKVTYDDDGEYEAEMNHHDYRVALMNILPEQIGAADYMDFCREQQREMWRE